MNLEPALSMQPRLGMADIRLAIASDAAPSRNGVGAYYEDLLAYLRPRLARAEVFSPTIEEGVWHAGLVLPMPGDSTQKLCFPNVWKLHHELSALDPHVVIVPTPGVYAMSAAFIAARRGIPLLVGFHTSFEQLTDLYWHGSLKGKVYRQYLETAHRYLFRTATAVLVNSPEMEALARDMDAPNIVRIGTPIPPLFARQPVVPYSGAFRNVLFAGRLAAEKNIGAIIESAETLPDLSFRIAGDGPLRSEVEAAAGRLPNLTYLGWLEREQLRDQVDANDGLVLPSHFESFGTIALEAMSRGRLVIVSPTAGIADWSQLSPGFETMGESGLIGSLQNLAALDLSARQERARKARDVAQAFNEENLRGWEDLLIDIVNR